MRKDETQFTAGPWNTATVIRNGEIFSAVIDEHRERICTMPDYGASAQANAQLMSYAPQMYALQEEMAKMLVRCENLLMGISELPCLPDGFQCQTYYKEWAGEIREYITRAKAMLARARGEKRENDGESNE